MQPSSQSSSELTSRQSHILQRRFVYSSIVCRFKSIMTRTLLRPFIMLVKEPILALVTLYLSVIYGLLYALFSVFPLIWEDSFGLRNFNNGETGLVFIAVGIGSTLGAGTSLSLLRSSCTNDVTLQGSTSTSRDTTRSSYLNGEVTLLPRSVSGDPWPLGHS